MADTTGSDDFNEGDDFFSGSRRDGSSESRGESLDEIMRDGGGADRRDDSIANIHTGSKEPHIGVMKETPPEGSPPPEPPVVESAEYTPGDPPPPIDPIDVDQFAGGNYQPEERPLDFEFRDAQRGEDRVFDDVTAGDGTENVRREGGSRDDNTEELILTPTTPQEDDDPTLPPDVDDRPDTPTANNAVLNEDDLAGGTDGDGPRSITQPLIIDFGDDGAGSVRLEIPKGLRELNVGKDGTPLTISLSEDGSQIQAVDSEGAPVFNVTLSNDDGNYSYTFDLQGSIDHGDLDQVDLPIGIAVTDSDGDVAVGEFTVGIVDDAPIARDDETQTTEEGGGTVGSDNGADNLLANDSLGADGALIFQFDYIDENGEEQTARAGETVDTENGTLTVNADGSWSFEADDSIDHSSGETVADSFTYSIVDADGDTSSASQIIEITDDGPTVGFPPEAGDPDGRGDQATLFEKDIDGDNASITQALEIDYGSDGEGSVQLTIPQALEDMNLTADGEAVTYTLSEDGQSIVATSDGEPVFTMSLSDDNGDVSYTFELQGNLDHPDVGSDVISNLPFGLTVTDGDGSTASAEIKINVVDDQPEAVGEITLTVDEGGNTVGSADGGANLLANDDLGADGGTLTSFTYTDENGAEQSADAGSTVDTENGSLTVNADGSWSFTSDENADHSDGAVSDGFTYTITDGDGDTSSATQNITITDDGPQIPPQPPEPPVGETPDGDQPDLGRADLIVDEDNMGAAVSQSVNVDFGDDGFGSANISVPQELVDKGLTSGGETITYSVSEDGQTITAEAGGEPVFTVALDANAETGEISYSVTLQGAVDHPADGAGDDLMSNLPVTLTVTDGDGTEASSNLEIGIRDDNPVATDDATVTLDEGGESLNVSSENGLLSNDDLGADGGTLTSFTYTDENGAEQSADAGSTVDTENGSLTVNADGSWSFTSDENADHSDGAVSDGFTYTITDGDGDTSSATQNITITDDGPQIPPQPPEPPVGETPDGDQPDLGRADLIVDEDNMGAAISQSVNVDFGDDGFGSANISVPQELVDKGLTSGGETITYSVSEDGQTITAEAGGEPVFTVALDANAETGEISYSVTLQGAVDHPADGAGDDLMSNLPVTLTVTDGDGTEASSNLEIGIRDDAPAATDDATVTLDEGGDSLNVSSENGLLSNDDLGADGGTLTSFTYTDENGAEQSADAGATVDTENGSLTVNADGSWSFTSDENADHSDGETVSDGFTYTITDGDGDTSSATQNITITDDGPQIPPQPPEPPVGETPDGNQPDLGRADLIVDEDNMGAAISQSVNVDFGDDGFGSANISVPQELVDKGLTSGGETITYSVSEDGQAITAEAGGEPVFTVALDANAETGEISYSVTLQGAVDHPADGAGDDLMSNLPVTLTVTDGDGTEASSNLEIGIRDDNPVATDDATVTLDEGGESLNVSSENGLLSNDDLGADGGTLTSFTYTDENGAEQTADAGVTVDTENGSLTVNADGSWSFTSDENADHSDGEAVSDGFTYTITDGDGDTSSATQNITITDDGPQIPPQPPEPPVGETPDGDQPDLGRADLIVDEDNMGAAISQSVNVDFGDDGFGSANISVPQELVDKGLTSGGETVTYSVSEDGQTITAEAGGEPVFTVALDANAETGEISYSVTLQGAVDHPADGAGDDLMSNLPVTLTVTDGDGTEASSNLEIGIRDDAPAATDDATATLDEGGESLNVSSENGLLSNDDLGADGGTLTSFTYTDENGAEQSADAGATVDTENGSLTVNSDGSWSFTSDENADHSDGAVSDGFTYTITDGDGDTSSATQNITITDDGPNIAPPTGEPGADGYSVTLDEDNLGSGSTTAGSQALNIDFGADGEGSVALSVPQELEDMGLTSGGEAVTFTVSEDGQSITGSTSNGSAVMTISLNEDGGNYSYSVELSDNMDHTGANGDAISDIPVTLTVTDSDGDTATAALNVNVIDDAPIATNDGSFNVTDGGDTVGTGNGADNLLANDEIGADGGAITSFTYTDENGAGQTADAGATVDTQQGSLTVNADGTWSFESDDLIESSDGSAVMDNFSYTVTDGDGDTATASVEINVSDGTSEPPTLVVGDGEGYEDNAIALNINADLTDADGSESLSITISGVPDGASLSAGSDNGDGTWTLEEGDLDGLTVTPPTDSDVDFDLSVSVTSTEVATGETSTVEDTFTVEVDAVADTTTVSATVEAKLVQPSESPDTEGGVIDTHNFGSTDSGFKVVGRDIEGEVDADNVVVSGGSLGVGGAAVGGVVPNQIGHNPTTGEAEGIIVEFDNDVSEASFSVSRLFENEGDKRGDASGDEQGRVILYRDGEVVGEIDFTAQGGNTGTFTVQADDGGSFDSIEFTATEYSGGDGTQSGDSSDYFVDEISFTHADVPGDGEPYCEVTVNVDATYGDFTDGSEQHFVFVEVPQDWEATVDGAVEVDNSDYPQLPADGTFLKVPVPAEQIQEGDGAVSVPVTFNVPATEAADDVQLDVFAAAIETNLDGAEITTDNNASFSSSSVTIEGKDLLAEPPEVEAENAVGYEDAAIPLDISASLADTDGSESLSVTISGVPEGASLSAGTDNGDGTWSLESGDLEGLTVTPPTDSDADFDLSVSATSTESMTGQTSTVETSLNVKVDAVADTTTVSGDATAEGVGGGDHEVTVNLNASFGDYQDGSETHVVLVEVPEGWSAPDGATVIDGGDVEGLPDQQFIQVEVSNADLVESGGSTDISVTFEVPDNQASGDINFNLISGAVESPSDDGEITLDNNTSYSSTSVTASYENGAPTVEAGEVRLDENNLGDGTTSSTGDINIDFGADGEGSVAISIPAELEDAGLTSGGETVTFTVSEDGQAITGSTPDGSPVLTITLNETDGEYSYTVELQAPVDHDGASGDLINDLPVTLNVTDGNGETTEATLNIDIADAIPEAVDDRTVTTAEGGNSVGSENGGDNLLTNDDLGADGSTLTSFTYTDENGAEQTADAGATVDTENGSLTVNNDGSWSFTSDENADHSDGAVSDGFTYTITDGDGDTSSASQTIDITDDGPQISPPSDGGVPGADGYNVTLDEGDLTSGAATDGGQALNIDFGADGEGSVALSVPQELEDMGLTSDGETVTFTVSDDGQSITGSTPDGSAVMTISLNEDGGNYSYSVELSDNLDHTGANGETISDIPVTLTVTDGDGDTATASLNVNVIDDAPVATDDGSFSVTDGGDTVGTNNGADNLLANDSMGADGGTLTSFTYTDENGEAQTADAGSAVDTQQGSLTVNTDGTWSFESDNLIESADGSPVMDNFTYTITDGDRDTATASVEINVSDGTSEPPALIVGDGEGYEDNAIALNINAGLTDTDGSENLSITISGVPDGASLSAGSDNGDGTWTLEGEDLDGLTVTPPTDSDVDFDLSVSVTSTEVATGETSTVEDTFTVEVDAVADAVGVSAEISAKVIPGEVGGDPETVEITIDNYDAGDASFTVAGRTLDSEGNLSEPSTDNISVKTGSTVSGFGVNGDASNGADSEIGYEDGSSEQVVVTFDEDVSSADVSIAWQNPNEDCRITLYRDGEPVGEVIIEGGTDKIDALGTFTADDGGSFDSMSFEATGTNSDFLVNSIEFEVAPPASDPVCEVEIDVTATFGDYNDGSEQHFVFVEVPTGMTPSDENTQTVEGNAENGLPEGQTFVAVPVDAADIQAGSGTVTVPVSFTGPVPADNSSVNAQVFASAVETNLDGGEITFDNNMTLEGTSVELSKTDITVEDPNLVTADAEGYEDNAIALDIDASLNDTDGSESLSVMISGVPEGATLSAGTDNGDGTWSLEGDDLEGLTVTPPTDSDVDFDLNVSATSTESSTGETSTVESTFTVEVDAVADPTTVNAKVETTLVPGTEESDGLSDVTVTNEGMESAAYHNTYGYYIKDEDGNPQEGGIVFADTKDGVGDSFTIEDVDADNVGYFIIPNGDNKNEGLSNGDAVTFEQDDSGNWHVVDGDGERLVGNGDPVLMSDPELNENNFDYTQDNSVEGNQNWEDIKGGGDNDFNDVNMNVVVTPNEPVVSDPQCEVTVNVDASFGDYTDGSEQHFVLVLVPEGWTPQDGAVVVNGSDVPGAPTNATFVKIEVPQEAIQDGEGSVMVSVDFNAPASEAGNDVQIDVFAGATETNLDGAELTTDNNTTLSGSSVTVDAKDLTVSDPDIQVDDASGLEDTAIALDLDISLTDTDGSETISVTISDVPEGATLSAGTDNGDGTYTLDESDLGGLTITPPSDSDVDFDLKVEVTVTEQSTGETRTFTEDVKVEVIADADAPTLDASLSVVEDDNDGNDGNDNNHGGPQGNNGFGNGDQDAPGNSQDNNNAENATDGSGSGHGKGAASKQGKSGSGHGKGGKSGSKSGKSGSGHGKGAGSKSGSGQGTGGSKQGKGSGSGHGKSGKSGSGQGKGGSNVGGGSGAGEHQGDGSTTYDLDIESALSDVDGSESLTIALGPVPEGITFSAGTDNGDGTWSVEPGDLQDLQMTVPANVDTDFDLKIAATSTEAENNDSESVNLNLRVELPEDHGTPPGTGGTGHGTGHGSGAGKSGSGHGKGGKSGSKSGKSGSGHGKGHGSKEGKGDSGSGHGKGGKSDSGQGKGGSKHGKGSGSGHGKGSGSGQGKGHGSGQGKGGSGSGHGKGGGSGHGKGHGSGQGQSGQGIAAAGGSGQGGGDRISAALDKFSNEAPDSDDSSRANAFADNSGSNNNDSGNWFDEDQKATVDDDVYGKTELEQKEEDDQKADEAVREEEEGGVQIPTETENGTEANFEDRSLV